MQLVWRAHTPNIIKLEIKIKWSLLTIVIISFASSCSVFPFMIFLFILYALRILSYAHSWMHVPAVRLSVIHLMLIPLHPVPSVLLSFWLFSLYVVIHNNRCDQYEHIQTAPTQSFVSTYKLCVHFFSASSLFIGICPPAERISDSTCTASTLVAGHKHTNNSTHIFLLRDNVQFGPFGPPSGTSFNHFWCLLATKLDYIRFLRPNNSKILSEQIISLLYRVQCERSSQYWATFKVECWYRSKAYEVSNSSKASVMETPERNLFHQICHRTFYGMMLPRGMWKSFRFIPFACFQMQV